VADPKNKTTKRGATTSSKATSSSKATKGKSKTPTKAPSKRYTPPPPKARAASPQWVPVTMFALLVCGAAIVILNYLGVLPGEQQNRYLFLGLGEITAGFIFATRYR
jgi:Cell division protein CrgA